MNSEQEVLNNSYSSSDEDEDHDDLDFLTDMAIVEDINPVGR